MVAADMPTLKTYFCCIGLLSNALNRMAHKPLVVTIMCCERVSTRHVLPPSKKK